MVSLLAALAVASTPVVITPEELVGQVLAEYKEANAYQPHSPLRKPGSKRILAMYDQHSTDWYEIVEQKTGLELGLPARQFAVGQCTWFAAICRPDFQPDSRGGGRNDARHWLDRAKAAKQWVGEFVPGEPPPLPQRGAIVVHKAWPGNSYGHVSIISEINPDGSLTVFDANFASPLDGKVRERVMTPDDYVAGYIYRSTTGNSTGTTLLEGPVKWFGTAEATEKSSGAYWYGIARLDTEVPDHGTVSVRIMPNLEQAQEYDITVWPKQYRSVRVSKDSSRTVGGVAVNDLPDRYAVVLIRPTRLVPNDKPLKAPFVYLDY